MNAASLDPAEVEKFSKMAAEWWNPDGKFGVLHRFNPVRLAWIKEQVTARFARDPFGRLPYGGLRVLDIGCGGSLRTDGKIALGCRRRPQQNITSRRSCHGAELSIDYRVRRRKIWPQRARSSTYLNGSDRTRRRPRAFVGTCASC
jgi:2-polyprenyl-6-hydroxyphenyl methylase/3-demethylubiquinone-9 3-methyltransferase